MCVPIASTIIPGDCQGWRTHSSLVTQARSAGGRRVHVTTLTGHGICSSEQEEYGTQPPREGQDGAQTSPPRDPGRQLLHGTPVPWRSSHSFPRDSRGGAAAYQLWAVGGHLCAGGSQVRPMRLRLPDLLAYE